MFHFKAFGMINLHYEITVCQKIYDIVTMTVYVKCVFRLNVHSKTLFIQIFKDCLLKSFQTNLLICICLLKFSPEGKYVLYSYFQLKVCMWFLAGMTSIQMMAALSFKPLMPSRDESEPKKDCLHQLINVDNWKNTKYVIWALAIPSALFGYFVPYVHIVSCYQISMSWFGY